MSERRPRVFALKHGELLCPECQSEIEWSCPAEVGLMGGARCSKGPYQFRVLSATQLEFEVICKWRGSTLRLEDGGVAIIFW
tara:strand:+ start:2117 stop:2362 length:246 start_codon:yes stop_codon:yes gene_type:complete